MEDFKRFYAETNEKLDIISCSKAFLEFTGRDEIGNLDQIIPSQDLLTLKNILFATRTGDSSLCCFRAITRHNELAWIAATVSMPVERGKVIKFDMNDIQTMKVDHAEGYYDSMTGLLSKSAITEYAKQLMNESLSRKFYFFIMDIDNFKTINDSYGHMKGDEVIIEVANIIKKCLGHKGVCGRIGGDEFMLILENISEEEELRWVLREIRYSVREKYMDPDNNKTVTVSLGGALFPTDADNYDSMFQLADKMLYLAKAKGRDRYIFYVPAVHGKIEFSGKVMNLGKNNLVNSAKSKLIMELMQNFLVTKSISFEDAMKKVLLTYGLDEAYLVDFDTSRSVFGIKRCDEEGENAIEEKTIDFSSLDPDDYRHLFDSDPFKLINIYDLEKDNNYAFANYMIEKGYRVMMVYYMRHVPNGGYLIYVNATNSTCRLAETDFSDLIYFSRMVELNICSN